MTAATTISEELRERFPQAFVCSQTAADGIPTLWLSAAALPAVLRHLKREIEPYRMLYDLTAIDERMREHRQGQPESDFTVVYHLLSFDRNEYLRLKVPLTEGNLSLPTSTPPLAGGQLV